jgi:hypothetical protein
MFPIERHGVKTMLLTPEQLAIIQKQGLNEKVKSTEESSKIRR